MGYYLKLPVSTRKVDWLIANCEAIEIPRALYFEPPFTTVCIVDNGPFEAAGIAFSQRELDAFSSMDGDLRHKTYLKMKTSKVIDLCPEVAERLKQ